MEAKNPVFTSFLGREPRNSLVRPLFHDIDLGFYLGRFENFSDTYLPQQCTEYIELLSYCLYALDFVSSTPENYR